MIKNTEVKPIAVLVALALVVCLALPFALLACREQPPADSDSGRPQDSVSEPHDSPSESVQSSEPPAESESVTDGGGETATDTESESQSETAPPPEDIIHGYKVDLELERSFGLEFEVCDEQKMAHGNVWLRSEPSTANGDASKVAILHSKDVIRRIGYTEKWSRVVYNETVCYVSSSYLVEYLPQNDKTDIYYEGFGENKSTVVVIDAGHQLFAMNDTEPNGPGSTDMKVKVTSGTVGVSTGIWEYQLNLDVSLRLRDLLLEQGYSVVMIRESNNVTISNVERAQIANKYNADAFVRIHANSSTNKNTKGALTMCQTAYNPYNANIYKECRELSSVMIEEFVKATGLENDGVWETDTMTGINWCEVPTTIVEMGYMSNPAEDEIMATDEFKDNAALGIFNGIVKYTSLHKIYG